jgi:hypothetical protein
MTKNKSGKTIFSAFSDNAALFFYFFLKSRSKTG